MNERLREYFHLMWMAAIALCAVAAAFALIFVSCTRAPKLETADVPAMAEATPDEAAPTPPPTPTPTPEPAPTELEQTEDMGEEYLSKFIFLGDSTTYGLAAYDALPWTQMWTTSIGTLDLSAQSYAEIDVYSDDGSVQSMTIRDAVAAVKPEYLLITLGINGISYMDEVEFKEEYTDLIGTIQAASPETKIICHSIYPVIDPDAPIGINNAGVNQANQWVYEIAEATGTRYLNTHDALADENGSLREEYCNGDGVHLDTPGCQAVLMSVRTHGYR